MKAKTYKITVMFMHHSGDMEEVTTLNIIATSENAAYSKAYSMYPDKNGYFCM